MLRHFGDAAFFRNIYDETGLKITMNKEIFLNGMTELSADITNEQTEKFVRYSSLLVEWNKKMNLTAVTDDDGISVKHFLDSVLPIYHTDLNKCRTIADVGTGAGFPGIPLAIMLSDVKFTLIDSLNKRVTFLKEVCAELNLDNVECIHARAEELGKTAQFREKFDAVVSRAVANMTVLCEYCLPYVRVGGEFIALKSEGCEDEISAAKPMIGTLGAKIENDMTVPLPQSDIMRRLVVIKKIKNTPDKFPRRADKIKKASQS